MPALTTTLIAAAALGAGATVYQAEEMKRMSRLQRDAEQAALDEQKAAMQKRQEEEQKMQVRDASRAEKKSKSLLAGGRQSTLLTSPLGVVSTDQQKQDVATKTLLGS